MPYAAHLIKAIGTKLGWSVTIFPASSPTQPAELAAMQQALLGKPNAIISVVIPAVWVGPALTAAKAAGIYTVDIHQDSTDGTGYSAVVPSAEGVQKALLAAWAVAKTNGKANTMLVEAPGFSDVNVGAAQSYLQACSGCTTVIQQFNPTSFTDPTQIQSNASSALSAHPSVNYVIWPTGGLPLTPVLDGMSAAPDTDAQLLVDDASPEDVQLLSQGKLPLVVEGPGALLVLEAIDNINRLEQGKQALAETAADSDHLLDPAAGARAQLPGHHGGATPDQRLVVPLRNGMACSAAQERDPGSLELNERRRAVRRDIDGQSCRGRTRR